MLQTSREAAHARRRLSFNYSDLVDQTSQRVVRPLGCFFWGKVWTLAAWCESRQDFCNFRLDQIEQITVLQNCFRDEQDKSLAQFLRQANDRLKG